MELTWGLGFRLQGFWGLGFMCLTLGFRAFRVLGQGLLGLKV